jgi:hypothetical protein
VLLAAFVKTFKWDKKIRKRLSHRGWGAVFLATGAALLSPLCSCGIVPLVILLIYSGVPLAPVFALLITSPLMSIDAFLISLRGLGPALAIGKLVSAAFAGLVGGGAVLAMQRRGWIREEGLLGAERPDIREKCLDGPVTSIPAIVLLSTIFQRSVIGVYLGVSLVTALGFGYLFLALGLG